MNYYKAVLDKLQAFIKKYYYNELIKGSIFFLAIGILYFFFTAALEYFLWLDVFARTFLFWSFILVEVFLLYRYIIQPLIKIIGINDTLSREQASIIIGNHFPEVSDKLLNVLQLGNSDLNSELILASIEQKSSELQPIPFKRAINFKSNIKYTKYLAIPIIIYLLISITGNSSIINEGYNRVVNYDKAYTPPAPFNFFIVNDDLSISEGEDFTITVKTSGSIVPEIASINYNNETYFLKTISPGSFNYTFKNVKNNTKFKLSANSIESPVYELIVNEVPKMIDFNMELNYPKYLNKNKDFLKNTGNVTVPEGTSITWHISSIATDEITFTGKEIENFVNIDDNNFQFNKKIYNTLGYSISTSNKHVKDYENVAYQITVVKDQFPEIKLQKKIDSLKPNFVYFLGELSDDYGLHKLQVVYNEQGNPNSQHYLIDIPNTSYTQFIYTFPEGLDLEEGKSYQYYFEVSDNDALHNFKKTKSEIFYFNKLNNSDLDNIKLEQQNKSIQGLNKSLERLEDQEKSLDELNKIQKEKRDLNWNDKKKLENFINRQIQQEEMMKNFNQDLRKNLDEFNKDTDDSFKEELQKRLNNQEKEIEENKELLDELKELQDKINQEDLAKKIDKLKKSNQEQQRSLEQIVELTKRYYVSKKAEKSAKDLENLAKDQEALSNKSEDNNTKEAQDKLNEKFDELTKQLDELKKKNEELRQPLDLNQDKAKEDGVKKEQKEASDKLDQNQKSAAKKNQKSAAEQMQQMSKKMQQAMQMQSGEQLEEDAKMLRQILDNLVFYSFEQESLMNKFKDIEANNASFSNKLKKQQVLREHFKHVDDSLFALSLRNPMISDKINKEVTDVHFNVDKTLELLAETDIYKANGSQQYAITAANNLADYLSEVLNNMQNQMMNSMPGSGQCDKPGGSGQQGFQLSDIIQQQEQNIEKMQEGMEGKSGKEKEGKEGEGKQAQQGSQSGQGNGDEDSSGELFRIYQEQQRLREQLKDALGKEGSNGNGDLLNKMEELEEQLLDKGFTNEVMQKMINLKHELLKLEDAKLKQGEDNKREANTNSKSFNNNTNNTYPDAKEYFNEVEILNRQALPLQTIYKEKVNSYFKKEND